MNEKVQIIGEIGINHNGDLKVAKQLIDVASDAGCDYVKFQKRNPDVCVPENQKNIMRDTPWGKMTYLEYKYKVEFGSSEYDEIDSYCSSKGIKWFASVWDKDSIDFMKKYVDITKIPSALINDIDLGNYARLHNKFLLVSTGMSSEDEIEKFMNSVQPDVVMHTNSTYPSPVDELNLKYITWLQEKWSNVSVGYSGHEYGLTTTFAATALGAEWIERHITLDRTMWGSDHLASVEPAGLLKLVKGIRDIESAMGTKSPRKLLKSENEKRKSLRK
jgi:N-acetylneuraminate synthase